MMEFFKANPAALMDALPTPPGSDAGDDPTDGMNKSFKRSIKPYQKGKANFDDNLSQASGRSRMSNRSVNSVRSRVSSNTRIGPR